MEMELKYSLQEIATANTHRIQSEDKFIRDIRDDFEADPQWNSRMLEFMMPLWKLRSKIQDLKKKLNPQLKTICDELDATNRRLVLEVRTRSRNRRTLATIGREFHRIEFTRKFLSTKMNVLQSCEHKARRMVSRAKHEEESHIGADESSSKIMDPNLNLTTIRKFIIEGLKTMKIAAKMNFAYHALHRYSLKSQFRFYKRKKDMIQIQQQPKSKDPNQSTNSPSDCRSGILVLSSSSIQPEVS